METISSIHEKSYYLSSHHQLEPHYLQNYPQQHKQSLNYSSSIINTKTEFLQYASSLIQITTQQDIPNQFQIYEQSQLINPPDSLILKYQNLKQNHQNQQTCPKQATKSKNNLVIQGVLNLQKFFENYYKKSNPHGTSHSSQTLIDLLAFSSVQNFTQKSQKILLEQAFHQLKFCYYQFKRKLKNSRPLLPIDKKRYVPQSKKQFIKTSIVIINQNKKQAVEQISGILTFKVLEIYSESFVILKNSSQNLRTFKFYKKLSSVGIKIPFQIIKLYTKEQNLQRQDSKILTLSRSKSKGSLSKLKIRNLKSNSQKKITVKPLNSCKNTDYSTSGQQNFNQRFISSEILEDFDFTQLQSNLNDDEYEIETQKKMQFNNRLKKKSLKESQSQAETLNSLRSLQSQQYQFGNAIQSMKVSSSLKPFYTKNYNSTQNVQQNEDVPTTKNISYDVKKKKTSFQTKFFHPSLNQAKQMTLFSLKQRRYLNVRTNLFELPLQLNLERQSRKEQMEKIYHSMPQKVVKFDNIVQEKDNFLTNIKSLNFKDMKPQNITEGGLFERQNKKKKAGQCIEELKSQNIYFQLRNVHSQKNISIAVPNTESVTQRNNKVLKRNNLPQQNLLTKNFDQLKKDQAKKMNKEQKIKSKKLTKNNFEQYYFKAQMQKIETKDKTRLIPSKEQKNQRPIKNNPFQNNQINNISGNRQFYQAEYRTSKLLSQGNVKMIKSLSPKVKLSLHSPYRTGKLGSKHHSRNPNNQTYSGRSDVSSKMSLQKCVKNPSNLLHLQIQSSANTPRNIHQYVPNIQPTILTTHRNNSKLKVFSQQAPRSLSPQQNNIVPHFFPNQNTERKVSFVTTYVHNNTGQQNMVRPPSNTVHIVHQTSTLVPTISNLSNQSKFQNSSPNVHQVINYGPNSGFNQQFINRHSSILSTHSHQSKQKIIIAKPSQVLMSPTQRAMHGFQNRQINNQNMNFDNKRTQQSQLQSNLNQKRGLNVMMRNNYLSQPQQKQNQLNSFRQKTVSNQRILITPRK